MASINYCYLLWSHCEEVIFEVEINDSSSNDRVGHAILRSSGTYSNNSTIYSICLSDRIVLAMASSGAMVTTYSGMAQQKREVNRE